MSNDCVFCKIVANDLPATKVFENKDIVAFLDINPASKGHTLIVPKQHFKDFNELPSDLIEKIFKASKKVAKATVDAVKADGYNIHVSNGKAAGQEVFHLHVHIIPRFKKDKVGLKWTHVEYAKDEIKGVANNILKAFEKLLN